MANNTTLNVMTGGDVVEDIDIGAGVKRQVVTIGDRAGGTVDSIGGLTETAPATDTASSGLNGRLQRIAQRATSLIALFPTALGSVAAASSLAVTQSTEDIARQGIITETAPASDTASSGQNGRLQRIAQRLTSLIAQVPTTLGQKVMSASMAVVIASDQTAVPGSNFAATISATVTRPADTNAYVLGDVWSTSTSAPTVGGNVLTGMGRASGGSGIITDIVITNSQNAALQGELWIFDTTVTAVNDNAAFALSDADVLKLVGVVPFLTTIQPSNGAAWVPALGLGYTCSGSANLIFLIKLTAAYTPISAEVFQVRCKIQQVT